jgi:RNA polymerase sigma-70 factor (ECF subfamily)
MSQVAEDSDGSLLERWRAGDQRATKQLIQRHHLTLRQFFFHRVQDDTMREDLIQETFKGLVISLHRFEGLGSFRAFLLGIATNKLREYQRDHYRKDKVLNPLTTTLEDLDGPSPSSLASTSQRNQRLFRAMAKLPLIQQEILEYWYWHDLTGPEIGDIVEMTDAQVRGHLFRARRQLQSWLGEDGELTRGEVSELDTASFEARIRDIKLDLS